MKREQMMVESYKLYMELHKTCNATDRTLDDSIRGEIIFDAIVLFFAAMTRTDAAFKQLTDAVGNVHQNAKIIATKISDA